MIDEDGNIERTTDTKEKKKWKKSVKSYLQQRIIYLAMFNFYLFISLINVPKEIWYFDNGIYHQRDYVSFCRSANLFSRNLMVFLIYY